MIKRLRPDGHDLVLLAGQA